MLNSTIVSGALDEMFARDGGLYGGWEDVPVISRMGHTRRVELLERLDIGDVTKMTVVDFGMGSWGFAAPFPKLQGCARAIGMDISPYAIKLSEQMVAEQKPPYWQSFSAYSSDGMNLPLEDASIDLFFSGESIEHVKFPPQFLSEIYRVLKPGGQLVVTTPNRDAIKYRERAEEYCTSPEHFWLFNYPELKACVEEFFHLDEVFGFNGSFGSHDEDAEWRDEAQAFKWSRNHEAEPDLATGIIMRLTKRTDVFHRYEVTDISPESVRREYIEGMLDLEFGLQGAHLGDRSSVTITRPPSDGFVARFWCHRWSGFADINEAGVSHKLDLYAFVPGWRQFVSDRRNLLDETIIITRSGDQNPKALSGQVIFFEAFTWKKVRLPAVQAPLLQKPPQLFAGRSDLYRAGYGFERVQPAVTTTVFLWFRENEGNVRGPWQPIGGRESWDGGVDFWRRQLKEMALSNMDAIYIHCINEYREQRLTLFRAYSQLRGQGWDLPKIAPFLDPLGLWEKVQIDVSTEIGKAAYVEPYLLFFEDFAENNDEFASSYLFTIDSKLVITTWWVFWLIGDVSALSREDVLNRLRSRLGARIPQLNAGIYSISTALVDPDLSFTDERMIMFSGYSYGLQAVFNGIHNWHVQPGYWDQNIRSPGYFLPRDGGRNYRLAWDAVVASVPHVHRVYVESWNEYDEGSGIYPADPNGLFVDRGMNTYDDVYSATNDPFEYVSTTRRGASKINGRPAQKASIQTVEYQEGVLTVVVRNEGNDPWLDLSAYKLRFRMADGSAVECPFERAATEPSFAEFGFVRGEPVIIALATEKPFSCAVWYLATKISEDWSL
jgi:ubiquinone/menaquinone biosynthesis C-methylase UbiE